jgi:HSP90 family molecular chaperone
MHRYHRSLVVLLIFLTTNVTLFFRAFHARLPQGHDQEAILNLLTGDRFYSNPSAALREAVLNAIDAIHRRRNEEMELEPRILVIFNREKCTLSVSDNGVGMDSNDVKELFAKVGASAAKAEAKKDLNR